MKKSVLDQWEAEANKDTFLNHDKIIEYRDLRSDRILKLIELVRKKDKALSLVVNNPSANLCGGTWDVVDNALALTKELK